MKELIAKPHSIYDDLYIEDFTTSGKLMEEFKNKKQFIMSGVPKVLTLVHNISEFDSNMFRQKEKICSVCFGQGRTVHIENPKYVSGGSTWIKDCDKCGTSYNFFMPTPLQRVIIDINAPIINIIAGYGSGKTELDMWIVARRVLKIDGSVIMIAGGVSEGITQAKMFIKGHFSKPWKNTKEKKGDFIEMNNDLWTHKNGSKIIWITAGSPNAEKFRTWQLDLVVMIEASADSFYKGGETSFFNEIKKRMRNAVSNVNAYDSNGDTFDYLAEDGSKKPYIHGTVHQIILESNPKNSDIIQEVFNKSSMLIMTEKVANKEKIEKRFIERYDSYKNGESGIVSILASSNDNPMLTEKYMRDAFPAGTSPAYIARMRDADLSKNEGQVFQDAQDHMINTPSISLIKTSDMIIQSFDPGTTHPSATIYAAFWKDYEKTGVPRVLIFSAYKTKGGTSREGNTISDITDYFDTTEVSFNLADYDMTTHKIGRWYIHPIARDKRKITRIADSAMWKTEKTGDEMVQDHITEAERYRKKGIEFKQALKGRDSIDYGITLVSTYFQEGIIKWDSKLEHLEEEFIKYEYESNSKGNLVPKDKDNHLMDCLRYLIFEIDAKLADIGKAPKVNTGHGDKMREALARRKISRDDRFYNKTDILEDKGFFSNRTSALNKNKSRWNK